MSDNVDKKFAHINKRWNEKFNCYMWAILPGDYYVLQGEGCLTTILGSCIAVTAWDKKTKIGGMNHFMLPKSRDIQDKKKLGNYNATYYGVWAMEHLFSDLVRYGVKNKKSLELKIFGGGEIIGAMAGSEISKKNINFILDYTSKENLNVVSKDLGGTMARKIKFFPESGRVFVKEIGVMQNKECLRKEKKYLNYISKHDFQGDIELFKNTFN